MAALLLSDGQRDGCPALSDGWLDDSPLLSGDWRHGCPMAGWMVVVLLSDGQRERLSGDQLDGCSLLSDGQRTDRPCFCPVTGGMTGPVLPRDRPVDFRVTSLRAAG